jgi:hypothetical protein
VIAAPRAGCQKLALLSVTNSDGPALAPVRVVKEEIHLRRAVTREDVEVPVQLRKQHAVIENAVDEETEPRYSSFAEMELAAPSALGMTHHQRRFPCSVLCPLLLCCRFSAPARL